MEQLVLQSNSYEAISIERFVSAICEDNHLEKYHAVISIAVMRAVDFAFSAVEDNQVVLVADHCRQGVSFAIQSAKPCFAILEEDTVSDFSVIISSLCDEFSLTEDGCALQMLFHVQGIDSSEASYRANVLSRFYASIHIAKPQFQLNEN